MKIRLMSDIHLEFTAWDIPPMEDDSNTVLILAGDILPNYLLMAWRGWFEDLSARFKSVVYVAGNHEHYRTEYEKSMNDLRTMARSADVLFLENEVVEISDLRIAGCTLWSNVLGNEYLVQRSMNDYNFIHMGNHVLTPYDTQKIHDASVKFLEEETYDIVVTHHAPSFQSCGTYKSDPLSVAYATDLSELIYHKKPMLWLHGHVHNSNKYIIHDTLVMSNCKGYPGENSNFQPFLTVEV